MLKEVSKLQSVPEIQALPPHQSQGACIKGGILYMKYEMLFSLNLMKFSIV